MGRLTGADAESSRRADEIRRRLETRLAAVHVEVADDSARHAGHPGAREGGHYRVVVVSERVRGLGRAAAHRLVYEAVADLMGSGIHALQIRTLTPEQWTGGS